MDLELTAEPTNSDKSSSKFRKYRLRLICFLVMAIFLFLVWHSIRNVANEQFTWLTPAEYQTAISGGTLEKFESRFINLIEPLLSRFPKKHSEISLRTTFLISSLPVDGNNFGQPVATNSEGVRAWIVSQEKFNMLERHLMKRAGSVERKSKLGIVDSLGHELEVELQNRTFDIGAVFSVYPKRVHDKLKLVELLSPSDFNGSSTNEDGATILTMNAAFRATVPKGSTIILEGRKANATNLPMYYFAFSPWLANTNTKPANSGR